MNRILRRLAQGQQLDLEAFGRLVANWQQADAQWLFATARNGAQRHYGNRIFLRGLTEVSNICQNDCYYCGIRRGNAKAVRYRLSEDEILEACRRGHALGLRTVVLQGGEDPWFTDSRLCRIIQGIKAQLPGTAVTLSLGQRSRQSYSLLRQAGADRYLLRHETADSAHYGMLHPPEMRLDRRIACLADLKDLGFQVGAGFMVGSPGQTPQTLAQDLYFLQQFRPHMVGIGPFIPHRDTPFAAQPAGTAQLTLFLLAVVRLILPSALLPATTALGTVAGDGWERGVLAGANVIMPNLTPEGQRRHYALYDNKDSTSAGQLEAISARMAAIGYRTVYDRGDYSPDVYQIVSASANPSQVTS